MKKKRKKNKYIQIGKDSLCPRGYGINTKKMKPRNGDFRDCGELLRVTFYCEEGIEELLKSQGITLKEGKQKKFKLMEVK